MYKIKLKSRSYLFNLDPTHLTKVDNHQSFFQSPLAVIFLTDSALLSNWDLYLITALLGALGVVVYLRRPTQQPAN